MDGFSMFVSGTRFFLAWLLPVSGAAQTGSGALPGAPLAGMCHPVVWSQLGLKTDTPRDRYIQVQHLAERRELVIDLGPMDVRRGANVEHGPRLLDQLAVLPMDGWLHGFKLELRDAAGQEVPRTLLHHIALVRPTYRDLFLPEPQRFMVMGA